MITMTSIHKYVIMCASLLSIPVTALAVTTHKIVISISSSGAIVYDQNGDGQDGNVIGQYSHEVQWHCGSNCTSLLIHFKDEVPCAEGNDIKTTGGAPAKCKINFKDAGLKLYPYKVTVNGTVSSPDPTVIVDNQVIITPKRKKPR